MKEGEVKTAQAVQLDISDECAHVATTGLKSDALTVCRAREQWKLESSQVKAPFSVSGRMQLQTER